MADAKKEAAPEAGKPAEGEAQKKSKAPLVFGGGALGLVALGFILSQMAVPKHDLHEPELEGPFMAKLSKGDIQVNLAGGGNKRYLVMQLQAEYYAYDESYVAGRLGIASGGARRRRSTAARRPRRIRSTPRSSRTRCSSSGRRRRCEQVTDPVLIDGFLEDVRTVVDPILFPIYLGDSHSPQAGDKTSGLKVGESSTESDFRGMLHEHQIEVDNQRKKVRLDDGPWVEYEGRERDLVVPSKEGQKVYVNLTELKPDFHGTVPIGVPGRVRAIYRDQLLVQ